MSTHEYNFSGVPLKFPVKAYPSQVAMMSKIITSIQKCQNSLLESPTGSGKSLALLCAALAWQRAEAKKVHQFNEQLEKATVNQDQDLLDALIASAGADGVEYDEEDQFTLGRTSAQLDAAAVALAKEASLGEDPGGGFFPDEDNDFQHPAAKRQKLAKPDAASSLYHLPPDQARQIPGSEDQFLKMPKKKKVPQIYFGTRTHKQVAQIVRELKKTAYSGVRMTILGARDHTCIHPIVSKSFNKNQECTELLDKNKGMGCRFQANVKQKLTSHHSLRVYLGHQEAWDLEDLVKVGKTVKACPYFATRELKTSAQIIFCPYNYLTDWRIRKAMQISLKNQIVILDEAHNIEDTAREASSGKWSLEDVTHAIQDLEKVASAGVEAEIHTALAGFSSRLAMWMDRCSKLHPDYTDFTSSSKVWSGTAGLAELNTHVFDVESYEDIKGMVDTALKERAIAMENDDRDGGEVEQGPAVVLARGTADLLESFMCVLGFMMDNDHRHRDDFKVAVSKAQVRKKGGGKGWFGKGDQSTTLENKVTLSLWCLNPAVCFSALKEDCRSIILTSGTLSPMVSFASELNVKFSVQLEANHVIDRKQVWVGTMSHGPTGHNLNATYKNTSTYTFQDELGKLIAGVCATIKHGVLVFFPSYKMLNDLTLRWQSTGLWDNISTRKSIVSEPKFANEFDVAMKMFYSLIKDTDDGPLDNGQDGALFLAVCRGKVSEGMDFADNNARAVICVGIPFPNVFDPLVDLKKKYNDQRKTKERSILSGGEWYEIQAFRALNQALGRCIRHKQDWGAILMVDDRFGKNERYVAGLSKWVRKMVVHHNQFSAMNETLKQFSADMEQMERDNKAAEAELRIKREMEVKEKREIEEQEKEKRAVNVKDCQATENGLEMSPNSAWSPGTSEGASATLASKVAMLKAMRSPPMNNPLSKKAANSKNLDSTTHLGFGSHMDSATHLGNNSNRYVPKSFGGSGKFQEPIDQSEQDKSDRKMRDKLKEFHRNPESKLKSPENGVEIKMRGFYGDPENGFDEYNDVKEEDTSSNFKFMTGKRNKKTGDKITKEMQDAERDKDQLVHLYNSVENRGIKREMCANDGEMALQETSNEDAYRVSHNLAAETKSDRSKDKIRNKLKMFQRIEDSSVEENMSRDSSSVQNQKERLKDSPKAAKWNGNQLPSSDIKVLNIAHPCPEKENLNGNVTEIRKPLKYDNDFISANVTLVNAQSSDSTVKLCDKPSVLSSPISTVRKSSEKNAFIFSKFEKEKSEDRDLENLLRFRRESGGKLNDLEPKINELEGNLSNDELWADSDDEFLEQFDFNEPVPDSKLEVKCNNEKLFDSDEDFYFPEDNEIDSKSPSPILSKKKPPVSSRKPLFAKSPNIVTSSSNFSNVGSNIVASSSKLSNVGSNLIHTKPVLLKENGLKRKAVGGPASKMQWISSDEEVEPPRQIKPSLKFEDDIEEDVVIERKVKQRRLSRKSLPKRQRTSLDKNPVVTNQPAYLSRGGDVHVKTERPSIPVATNQSLKVSPEGFTEVYTDGACTNNGRGNAKAGVGVWWGDNHPMNLSQPVDGDKQTNNTAEIQAACQAIRQAADAGIRKLLVHTDSQFVINCVTMWMANWKRNEWTTAAGGPVKNKEDLVDLDAAINSGNIQVKWNHVRGHSGNVGNEGADKLAVQGAKMQTLKNVLSTPQTKKSVTSANFTQKSVPSAPQSKKSAQFAPRTERTFVVDSDDDFV